AAMLKLMQLVVRDQNDRERFSHWGARFSEKFAACKTAGMVFIPRSAASFVITPLVPGFPSLDVKPHSPGETRQSERMKVERGRMKNRRVFCPFIIHPSSF